MPTTATHPHRRQHVTLWIIQSLLALLFACAGSMKLVLPLDQMQGPVTLPGALLRFIGVCEVLGALGLVLPGILRIQTRLTPVAAAGLATIMAGATLLSIPAGFMATLIPLVVGVLAAYVALGRARIAPLASRSPAF